LHQAAPKAFPKIPRSLLLKQMAIYNDFNYTINKDVFNILHQILIILHKNNKDPKTTPQLVFGSSFIILLLLRKILYGARMKDQGRLLTFDLLLIFIFYELQMFSRYKSIYLSSTRQAHFYERAENDTLPCEVNFSSFPIGLTLLYISLFSFTL